LICRFEVRYAAKSFLLQHQVSCRSQVFLAAAKSFLPHKSLVATLEQIHGKSPSTPAAANFALN
jgi:hypothetical protein